MIRSFQAMINNKFTLDFSVESESMLLREFLQTRGISKRTLTAVKYDGGKLMVNGVERTVRHTVEYGDTVTVQFPIEQLSDGLKPEMGALSVIYEDDVLLILDKPAGQSSIPSRDQPIGTVANFVAGKFAAERVPSTVHVVTRLDRDTSGLMCIAKNRHIHHLLNEQMRIDGFTRGYTALVEGDLKHNSLSIEQPIGRKDGSIMERIVRSDGQYARTDLEVTGRFKQFDKQYMAINLKLYTGRTHQIRVHMNWLGHPLVGDDLYGGSKLLMNRQALHCSAIGFRHPLTNQLMQFESSLPLDMQNLIREAFTMKQTSLC